MYIYNQQDGTWYKDVQPLFQRVRRWIVSTGLEMPEHSALGYRYRWNRPLATIRRSIRSHPGRATAFGFYSALCPLSLFGRRVTLQPFGIQYYRRRIRGWYCLTYDIVNPGPQWRKQWKCYRSADATPQGADRWYFGAPRGVVLAAQTKTV